MGKTDIYKEIKKRCVYIGAARSHDYAYSTEQWKNGNVLYTVRIKVNPKVDTILSIRARMLRRGGTTIA